MRGLQRDWQSAIRGYVKWLKWIVNKDVPVYYYQDERKMKHREEHPNDHSHEKDIINDEEKRMERLNKCVKNLHLHNSGKLQASREKVQKWQEVIRNNGHEYSKNNV